MAQGGKLASYRPAIYRVGEKFLDKIANFIAARVQRGVFLLREEGRELSDVGGIGGDRERRQSLFDFQVIKETSHQAGIGVRSHTSSMRVIGPWGEVTSQVLRTFSAYSAEPLCDPGFCESTARNAKIVENGRSERRENPYFYADISFSISTA